MGGWCLGVGWTYGWVVPRGRLDLGWVAPRGRLDLWVGGA